DPLLDPFSDATLSSPLPFHDFSDSLVDTPPLPGTPQNLIDARYKIVTPYNAQAFRDALTNCNISHRYPLLYDNITKGFPLGH
ncbi:hypothetical protein EV361DRAFT_758884, partial [Lentinula raphanica]